MSELVTKQKLFVHRLCLLFDWLYSHNYEITLGEVYRPEETAKLYAAEGIGIVNSLHRLRLAIDVNLWLSDKLLTATKDYEAAGCYWESLSTPQALCKWGGRFTRADGNHFSIANGGYQ